MPKKYANKVGMMHEVIVLAKPHLYISFTPQSVDSILESCC